MQINTNYHFSPVEGVNAVRPVAAKSAVGPAPATEDVASFPNATALNQALAQTPDIRADKVARAKELVKQSDYPPAEMVKKIGELLAGHLSNR
ncbi:hypothetical protein LBMAG56_26720 [Verrucomicrobiota bacterium]|nr:hypothetical protein LBMAG56_26720 [Verrucomicrobiota bacterium]